LPSILEAYVTGALFLFVNNSIPNPFADVESIQDLVGNVAGTPKRSKGKLHDPSPALMLT